MPRAKKKPTCTCAGTEGHEVTCPAFDVDAELGGNVRTVTVGAMHTNGASARIDDDDDDDDDDDPAVRGGTTTTVDGAEAIIDSTPAPPPQTLVPRISHDELMHALLRARRILAQKTAACKDAKDAQKLAQLSVDAIVAELAVGWEERDQQELPLTNGLCGNCGSAEGTVPVLDAGEKWCVPCVQHVLVERRQAAPPPPPAPSAEHDGGQTLFAVIDALAAALRFEDVPEWTAVEALATDPRDRSVIAGDLARIASQHGYGLQPSAPFVVKRETVPA